MKNAEQELEEKQLEKEQEMGAEQNQEKGAEKKHTKSHQEGYLEHIKSLITFNKGGDWKRLKAPERDVEGRKYDCGEFCFLNLYGVASEYPPYYSVDSAAGLIIANGSVGRYLSNEHENINTFLTRDGGLNWFEIRKGSHIYEIGDHGALILLADDQNPTKEIFYSWDEGLTFEPLRISDEKFLIKNIIIEPTSTSQHFVIYGQNEKKGDNKGVVIGLDFSGLHEPQCRNPDMPDTQESDYEKWTPNDGRAGKDCLMGHKTIYIRRKRESKCFNGLTFERKSIVEHCDCSESDYECDFGFARHNPGEPCINIKKRQQEKKEDFHTGDHPVQTGKESNNIEAEILAPPANCHGYYKVSKGYRKVPGNTCVNGVKFDPILIPCPYSGMFAHLGVVFFVLILAVLVIIVIVGVNKYYSNFLPIDFFGGSSEYNPYPNVNMNPMSNKRDYTDIVRNFFYFFFIFLGK